MSVQEPTEKAQKKRLMMYDPVGKQEERGFDQEGLSPMDPPDAYAPPGLEPIPAEDLHPFLAHLCDEHDHFGEALDAFEATLQSVKESGFSADADREIMRFLSVVDAEFMPHSREEEATLFPLLEQRLLASGEHSKGGTTVTTPVDVMRDEHGKVLQLASVVLNLIRLGCCLPDRRSARIVVDAGLREAETLAELLRLHLFREDNIVFASAQRLISTEELDALRASSKRHAKP